MSDYFTITGKRTGHRWLIQVAALNVFSVTVRREWEMVLGSVAYTPKRGFTFTSRLPWWAMTRARLHIWWSDLLWHRKRVRAQKLNAAAQRVASRGDRP